jgi:hypothetical protein
MNRILLILLVVLLAGIGVIFLLNDPSSEGNSAAAGSSGLAQAGDSTANEAADAASTLENAAHGTTLTRAELDSQNHGVAGAASNLAPSRIHMQLVENSGAPIAGATLTATERSRQDIYYGMSVASGGRKTTFEASATTDKDGRVTMEVEPGKALQLEGRGEFWAPFSHRLAALAPGEDLDLGTMTLTAGDLLVGRVLDPSGKPLAGASVGLEESGSSMMRGSTVTRHATTAEDGSFRMGGLPTGKYRVQARSAGFVAAELDPLVIPGTGRAVEATLAMTEGRVAEGTVVDIDGRPVVGAFISRQMRLDGLGVEFAFEEVDQDGAREGSEAVPPRQKGAVETDKLGHFRIGGLDDQDTMLVVNADGYSTTRAMIPPLGEEFLVRLQPRLTLSGTLLLPNGKPAAKVAITAKASGAAGEEFRFDLMGARKVTTDAAGNFAFRNLSAGAFLLSAYQTHSQVDAMPVQVYENIVGMNIKMVAAEHLIVAVESAAGENLGSAKVNVTRGGGGNEFGEMVIQMGGAHGGSTETINGPDEAVKGETDASGVAILPGVVKGERRVTVKADGFADGVLEFVRNSGEQRLEMVMQPAASLRAVVKTVSGRQLSGVEVYLKPQFENGEELTQKSGLAGRVVWDDLRPGAYELGYREASSDGMGMMFISMDGEQEDGDGNHKVGVVELVGRSTLEMEIMVDDMALPHVEVSRNGTPAGGVQVWLETAESANGMMMGGMSGMGAERPVISGADGVALLSPKEPGTYTLVARAGNHAPQVRKEVEIHSGEESLRIEVLGSEVTGTLFANSKPVPGASLSLTTYQEPGKGGSTRRVGMIMMVSSGGGGAMSMETGNPTDANAVSDSDGVYRFTDVPAGTWVVKSRAAGFEKWESEPFSVGDSGELNLGAHQLLSGASISGRNLASQPGGNDGMFDMNSLLRLQDENGQQLEMAMGNPDGSYSFLDLPAGHYKIVRGEYESEILNLSSGQQMNFDLPKE